MTRKTDRWLSIFPLLLAAFALVASLKAEVKLIAPAGYLAGMPFLARVEVLNETGARDWDQWDGEAILSSDNPAVTLSTNKVALRNGLGTALITISGSANFNLRAQVGSEQAQRAVVNRSAEVATSVSGTLPGASTTWSGIIRVTGTVTVPAGHTLTIDPGTLVLINGVASGMTGINIVVNGAIRSLGTEAQPVVITCADATQNWGQIWHETSQASLYEHTFISRAGRTAGEGHTFTGPAFRITNSTVDFQSSVISDLHAGGANIGKIMMATGSSLTFNNCVLARARMGPEIASTGLTLTNSYIMQMNGPDDADGFYLHESGGRALTISGCVIAGGDDDAIDTLDSNATIENCIIRDWPNPNEDAKGLSGFNGEIILRRCLIVNTFAGVSTKSSGPLAVLRMDHCTISAVDRGVAAATKANASAGNISIYMTNCIVTAADSIVSDFTPDKFVSVTYCAFRESWPGTGNLNVDPLFISPATGNFRLQPASPCINAGDPNFPADTDGSRTEMGFYPAENVGDFFYVTLTSPTGGATYVAPTNLVLTANAFSSTGTVTRVQFFEATTKIGEATAAPYNFTWTNVPVGNHTLHAIATQLGGSTATSEPVSFSVRATPGATTNIVIARGAEWTFLDDGSNQGTAWYSPTFNDGAWKTGRAELGYGDDDEITPVGFGPVATNKYVTTYFRRTFFIEDVSRVERVSLELLRDDGAAVYLNNREAYRVDLSTNTPIGYRQYADRAVDYTWLTNTIDKNFLVTGLNTIAVEMHQGSASSGDLSFDLALALVMSAPTNAAPFVSIDSPAENTIFGTPANITVNASAFDFDGTVANVALHVNGGKVSETAAAPYALAWNNVAPGDYTLTAVATDNFGLTATSGPVHVTVSAATGAPVILAQLPAPGVVADLREITVTFDKSVRGINAADLLINGAPASGVTGSGATYTFSFATPPPGTVVISWAANHGITDTFVPPNAFNAAAPDSTWQYEEFDTIAPTIFQTTPARRDSVSALNQISVTFSEVVTGVNAGDLLINLVPATAVTGNGAGPYRFSFSQPAPGAVAVSFASGHGIADVAGNAFAATAWTYTLDPNLVPVVINEIMYHPASENPREEYIELFNQGAAPVNLNGWRFSDGVDFVFPNVTIAAGGYLVVAADTNVFKAKYPDVNNVIGNWTGALSNSREDIELQDASGDEIDRVLYADEGDWAVRQRSAADLGRRGWTWFAEHDGGGKSVELVNARMSNDNGQNWASSITPQGTPGRVNSVFAEGIAPVIENVSHFPLVPKSTNEVLITARIKADQGLNVSATLFHRTNSLTPPDFASVPMRDDGLNGDAAANDGVFSVVLPPRTNSAVVEFYVRAVDGQSRTRTWPAAAIAAVDGTGPVGQVANAMYQVDDSEYLGNQPLYKVIMTEAERVQLDQIQHNIGASADSDASMNATFIGRDGTGSQLRYLTSVRNRGHGSRSRQPNNFRVNFRSDEEWKNLTALNINGQFTWLQVLGAALNLRSEIPGAYSIPVQFRVNNTNLVFTGLSDRTYGSYAANEPIDSDWADHHFPNDSEGNIYRAQRDLIPPAFDYRVTNVYTNLFGVEDKRSYTNTWFKESNASEDNWTDLIGMLRVMGTNGTTTFNPQNIEAVVNSSEWLRHLAVMNLLGNNETGLNTGFNDDYFMYRGVKDPRFVLMYYDLDTILGFNNSLATNAQIYSAGLNNGSGAAIGRFMRNPVYEPVYHAHLRDLLETSFSAPQFNALVDQTLDWVPENVRGQIKTWMTSRRAFVLSQIPTNTPALHEPRALLSAGPRSPTPQNTATFTVGGEGITHYRYSLNGAAFDAETPIATPISLTGLSNGAKTLSVIGKRSDGALQTEANATTAQWTVNSSWPGVRLNEILASRSGGERDAIELYNDGSTTVTLTGMGLTDNASNPFKFTFGAASLAPGAYLVLDSAQLGFALDAEGETISLFGNGGALLDSVTFGAQLLDLSIGRVEPNGGWQMNQPTLRAANVAEPTSAADQIKINEWLAAGVNPYPDDFVELFNPQSEPVDLGGAFLTDQPLGDPLRSPITPLSFVAAHGYAVFTAGNGNQANEINFNLAAESGEIALRSADGRIIDSVVYGSQRLGVSQGRCGDGESTQKFLLSPTPGGPNECPFVPPPPQTIQLIAFNHAWKYEASATDLGSAWKNVDYDDSSWKSGPGLLGDDNTAPPEPIRTTLPIGARTFYFRTRFTLPPDLTATSLQLSNIIDDGAAFYLNGQEIPGTRYNLATNATYSTLADVSVDNATLRGVTAPATLLQPGENVLAVEVHQQTANSMDVVFGLKLEALAVTNSPAVAGVLINEVFADNANFAEADGSNPDWVELYNPSNDTVDLGGMSLTDQLTLPTRWVFPAGSIINAKSFYKVKFDSEQTASASNTGFGLKANGGAIYLFNRASENSTLLSSVRYGLQATDWSIGRVPDGGPNWALTVPSLGIANIAATRGNVQNLKINEWMAEPSSGSDWFEIFNPNAEPVDISRVWLSDSVTARQKTQLPALSFIGVGSRAFQRFNADDNVNQGADHVAFKLEGTGEAIAISTPAGVLINSAQFGPQQLGVSQGRLPDGAGAITAFRGSASPGAANFLLLQQIVINEVLTHTDSPLMDAVEFYNPTGDGVDISGWFLSDSGVNLRKFQIPNNTIVPPNGYLVLYENQFNSDLATDPFSFSSANGDEVFLSEADNGVLTGYRAAASFGASENGVSFGRFPTSQGFHFVPMAQRTFGRDNPTSTNDFALGKGAANSTPKIGPIVISEIMYHPGVGAEPFEYVELHNVASTNVPLYDVKNPASTWRTRKGADFEFATGATIAPGGYLVLVNFDPQADALSRGAFEDAYQMTATLVGPFRGALDNSGEAVELQKPDAPQLDGSVPYVMVDRVDYDDTAPWPVAADGGGNSLNKINVGLYGNDPTNWFAAVPSPGRGPIPDSDHDGMPDEWEIANGLDPAVAADAFADKDADGVMNRDEYFAGTDPQDPSDPLVIHSATTAATGLTLQFGVAAGKTYSVLYSDNSPMGPWVKLRDITPASTGFIQVNDTPPVKVRFYRLATPATP
jgi:hypothetical protein